MGAHGELARLRKVIAVLALVPTGETTAEVQRYATMLARMPEGEREALAATAGQHPLSPEAWQDLVKLAMDRIPNGQLRDAWSRYR